MLRKAVNLPGMEFIDLDFIYFMGTLFTVRQEKILYLQIIDR